MGLKSPADYLFDQQCGQARPTSKNTSALSTNPLWEESTSDPLQKANNAQSVSSHDVIMDSTWGLLTGRLAMGPAHTHISAYVITVVANDLDPNNHQAIGNHMITQW